MDWLKARLAEPSTHNALAVALYALGPAIIPAPWSTVAAAVFAALGFVLPEKH